MAVPSVILGISTDTRSMGIAVLRDGELIDWRIKTFRGDWSKGKMTYMLRRLETVLAYFAVTAIAFIQPDALKESVQQEFFAKQLAALAKRHGIQYAAYPIHDLRRISGERHRSPRKNVADYVLDKYPEIRHVYLKERNNKRQYYFRMFEAILCAHLLAKEL